MKAKKFPLTLHDGQSEWGGFLGDIMKPSLKWNTIPRLIFGAVIVLGTLNFAKMASATPPPPPPAGLADAQKQITKLQNFAGNWQGWVSENEGDLKDNHHVRLDFSIFNNLPVAFLVISEDSVVGWMPVDFVVFGANSNYKKLTANEPWSPSPGPKPVANPRFGEIQWNAIEWRFQLDPYGDPESFAYDLSNDGAGYLTLTRTPESNKSSGKLTYIFSREP